MRIKINTHNIAKKLLAKSYKLKATKGFTLVELLVTLSLFVILSGIVLFSQQKFNGSILLTNLAYDVALTVRQAQTFGINVREDLKTGSFQLPYGAHFDATTNNNKQFLIFADVNGTGKYETPSSDSLVNSYSIKKGNYISDICVTSSGTSECGINQLGITFLRPDPDARFKSNPTKQNITEAKIIISSPTGDSRNVSVNSTGQISINRGGGKDFKLIGVATCNHSDATINTFNGSTWSPKSSQFDPFIGQAYSESTCGNKVPQKHKIFGQSSGSSISCQDTEQSTASWYTMCVKNFTSCGDIGFLDAGSNQCKHNDGVYP